MTSHQGQSARIAPAVMRRPGDIQQAVDEPPLVLFTTMARDRRLAGSATSRSGRHELTGAPRGFRAYLFLPAS